MSKKEGAVKDWLRYADMLTGALPYMQKYNVSIMVVMPWQIMISLSHFVMILFF